MTPEEMIAGIRDLQTISEMLEEVCFKNGGTIFDAVFRLEQMYLKANADRARLAEELYQANGRALTADSAMHEALKERDEARAQAAAMREILATWHALKTEGFTQRTCDRLGLGVEHVRGGSVEVAAEISRRVEKVLAEDAGRALLAERQALKARVEELQRLYIASCWDHMECCGQCGRRSVPDRHVFVVEAFFRACNNCGELKAALAPAGGKGEG